MRNDLTPLETALELLRLRRGLWPVVFTARRDIQTKAGPKIATGKEPIGLAWGKSRPTEARACGRCSASTPPCRWCFGPAGGVITDLETAPSLRKLCGGIVPKPAGQAAADRTTCSSGMTV